MKTRLLWALLSWLSLLSFGARAQTNVLLAQENFEPGTAGTNPTYGYTANNFQVTSNTQYFQRQQLNTGAPAYPGTSQQVTNIEGSYAWTAEGVRGTGTQTVRSAGYVALNSVTTSGYKNFSMTVAFADPAGQSCNSCSRNGVLASDRVRLQYSFDGGPFVTAGLLVNNADGYWQQDTSTPLDSVADGTIINQNFQDITARISGTGSSLRVRVVCDFRSPILVFDNIRVFGDVNAVPTPTLNGLETTAASYTEGGGPVQLTSSLTVGYSDNTTPNLTGGTVNISANFASGDQLNFVNQLGITGSYNTGNGILTLTGTTSQANYQTALRSITYSSTNTTTLNTGTRQITFRVQNGSTLSNSPVRTLNIRGVLNAAAALNYTENFDVDADGTRYSGNTWADVGTARVGSFRATASPATYNGTQIGDATFTGWSGGYWFGEGTATTANPTNPYGLVQLAPVNAAGRSNIRFTVAIGAAGPWLGYFNANNVGDQFELFYSTDGGTTLTKFGAFYGVDGTTPARQDADLDPLTPAAGTLLGTALRDFTFDIPAAAAVSNLTFVLRQRTRAGGIEIAYDNIRITAAVAPTVTTGTAGSLTATTAVISNNTLTADGGANLSDYGVVYVAGTGTPTTANSKVQVGTTQPTSFPTSFTANLAGLTAGTQYTARAYATNSVGTSYGASVTFTTISAPTVTTATPSTLTTTSAVLGGNATADGGAAITERGVVYSTTNQTPTTSDTKDANGTGVGSFSKTIAGLTPSTTYYVRAYATNSAGTSYGGLQIFTTAPVVIATAQNVTVQLNANGTATLNASSVNNGSTGPGTLTYTIQKIVYGRAAEGQVLTLSTPTGENFSAIRFASYGAPTGNNGNYVLSGCNASNSTTVVSGILLGNPSGSITANNTTFGDPCGGTVKSLAVVAAYSASAASLPYTCANVAGPNYVLLTAADGSGNTSTMTAQVTVVAPPTASFTLSPTSGNVGATITASGSNLSGATALTVNGAAATISNLTANGFTFAVPAGATIGAGSVVLTTPCSQAPSVAFTVTQPVTAAPVVTAPGNGSLVNSTTPAYTGTAPAGSTVTLYVDGISIGTTTATAGGSFNLTQPTDLTQGAHTVRATAQTSGSAVSATSDTNTFTVDSVRPSVAITSSTAADGGTTSTSPIAYTVTFSENVTGFVTGDVTVTNGTITSGSFSGTSPGTVYSFTVMPGANGAVTVNVPANVAQDAATNGNTAAPSAYSITYTQPVAAAPTLTAVAPTTGGLGQAITLTGTSLGSPTALTINGADALAGLVSNDGSTLVVRVPVTAASAGTVRITTATGTATLPFTLMPPPGNALAFDGANDYVRPAGTLPATGEFTLEAWVNPTALPNSLNALVLADDFPAGAMHCQFYGNQLGFTINGNNPTDVVSAVALPLGRWAHVAIVYSASASTVRFYLNGALVTTGTYTTARAISATAYSVGAWLTGGTVQRPFTGRLDELRIYSAALSQAQVQADMLSTAAAVPANLALYLNFDQGTPATASTGANAPYTTLYDLSPNATPATLANFALASGNTSSNYVASYALVVPVATAATSQTSTSFIATWTAPAIGTVTSYLLDISTTPDFASPVAGSPFSAAASATSYGVTGLTQNTTYYYRVRALNSALAQPDQGAFSNTRFVATPLPVELVSFTATAVGRTAVRLAWVTASEVNSARFEVERSLDGSSFQQVNAVAAAGTTTTVHTYGLLDATLPTGTTLLYYRLRQVDVDGTAHYSVVRPVALAGTHAGLSLYPNPVHSGAATLLGAAPGTRAIVLDALGRTVFSAPVDATGTATLQLPLGLAAGVYIVRAGAQALRLTVE